MVEFSWQTRSQEKLQVLAHSESTPGSAQYDLLIDGVSFFRLPSREMVEGRVSKNVVSPSVGPSSITASDLAESRAGLGEEDFSDDEDSVPDPDLPYEDLGLRLSMAGFSGGVGEREPVDELHSDVSSMVELLRTEITKHLPQAEGLVSRAIIHSFFPDNESETTPSDSSFSIARRDAEQVEADSLFHADEWTKLNLEYVPTVDVEDRVLAYFQKHVETLFSYVRNEEIAAKEASRILLNVAAVLRLDFATPLSDDTAVLEGFEKRLTPEDFRNILGGYGALEASGLCKSRCYGFCRFQNKNSLRRLKAASDTGRLFMGGERVVVTVLSEKVEERRLRFAKDDLPERVEASEGSTEDDHYPSGSPRGDSVPHLMGALSNDDMMFPNSDIGPLTLNRCVSDGWVDTGLYDNTKIPHQVSPDSVTHIRKTSFFTDAFANGFPHD